MIFCDVIEILVKFFLYCIMEHLAGYGQNNFFSQLEVIGRIGDNKASVPYI